MAPETAVTAPSGSVEALKRVKSTENEWDTRLSAARTENETTLRRLREEADGAVKAAQAEADRHRIERIEKAQAEIAAEADAIVADGRKAAESATRGEGRRTSDKKDAILDVVLGSFGKD